MKTIKIRLKKDKENGCYYADIVSDLSLTMIKHTFDSLTSSSDGSIIEKKVRKTHSYKIKRAIRLIINRITYLFKSLVGGVKNGFKAYGEYLETEE